MNLQVDFCSRGKVPARKAGSQAFCRQSLRHSFGSDHFPKGPCNHIVYAWALKLLYENPFLAQLSATWVHVPLGFLTGVLRSLQRQARQVNLSCSCRTRGCYCAEEQSVHVARAPRLPNARHHADANEGHLWTPGQHERPPSVPPFHSIALQRTSDCFRSLAAARQMAVAACLLATHRMRSRLTTRLPE